MWKKTPHARINNLNVKRQTRERRACVSGGGNTERSARNPHKYIYLRIRMYVKIFVRAYALTCSGDCKHQQMCLQHLSVSTCCQDAKMPRCQVAKLPVCVLLLSIASASAAHYSRWTHTYTHICCEEITAAIILMLLLLLAHSCVIYDDILRHHADAINSRCCCLLVCWRYFLLLLSI